MAEGATLVPLAGGSYDLVILGGSPAGGFAAQAAARRGARAALVVPPFEELEPLERTPLREEIRRLQARFGLVLPTPPPCRLPRVDVYPCRPVFHRDRTIAVGNRELRFRRAILAPGTTLGGPPFPATGEAGCLWPETLGQLAEVPRRLAVVGMGAEGCAWAQAFCRLGSQVHLIGREPAILPGEDPDAATVVQARLEQEGVRLHPGCGEPAVETMGNLRSVVLCCNGRKEKLLVDEVLICAARRPDVAELALETAGVACDAQGIAVDARLRTSNRRVFAAGAVLGAAFASRQAARATAELAVRNALGWFPHSAGRLVVSRCTHTEPAVARAVLAGTILAGAGNKGYVETGRVEVDVYRADLADADPSLPPALREGFVKLEVHRRSGRVQRALVVAERADELLAPLALLMARKLPIDALAEPIACHSSRAELLVRFAQRVREERRLSPGARIAACCGAVPRIIGRHSIHPPPSTRSPW